MNKNNFPILTVILLLLNVIFYGVALTLGSPNRVEIERMAGELTNYCLDHPYLNLPQETFGSVRSSHLNHLPLTSIVFTNISYQKPYQFSGKTDLRIFW